MKNCTVKKKRFILKDCHDVATDFLIYYVLNLVLSVTLHTFIHYMLTEDSVTSYSWQANWITIVKKKIKCDTYAIKSWLKYSTNQTPCNIYSLDFDIK